MQSMHLTGASEASLAMSIGGASQEALAEAYRRHSGAVLGLARRILRDPHIAEEITQEVFVRLWNRPERFDPERGSMRSFLLADTHGRSIDVIRSEDARRRREENDARLAVTDNANVEDEVWTMALSDQIKAALASLGEGERKAIELAYFHGQTYREVAAALGEPEGTVKSRIRTGLRRLRGTLADVRHE